MFIWFVVAERDQSSDQRKGAFVAVHELYDRGELAAHELLWFQEIEQWFNQNLRAPRRLAWSRRPHAPLRAISWFRGSARDCVARMRDLVALLAYKDVLVEELRTDKPGYIVYEDEHQVAAIPFGRETF